MAFFESFSASLQQKWLDYYQRNRSWIKLQMKVSVAKTADGGQRPASLFILGVVNALEPRLSTFMVPFYQLNPDADTLINVLGLNFDPEQELAKRSEAAAQTTDAEVIGLLPDAE